MATELSQNTTQPDVGAGVAATLPHPSLVNRLSSSTIGTASKSGVINRQPERLASQHGPLGSVFRAGGHQTRTEADITRRVGEIRQRIVRFNDYAPQFSALELAIIRSPEFRRLGDIHQMSMAFSMKGNFGADSSERSTHATSANRQQQQQGRGFSHTRADHSIGVHKITASICEQNNLHPKVAHALRLAALLHDIGHVPFSHSGETILQRHGSFDVDGKAFDHDEFGIEQIEHGPFKAIIDQFRDSTGITAADVALILKDSRGLGFFIKEICDRLDYLNRDTKCSGFNRAVTEGIAELTSVLLESSIEPHDSSVKPGSLVPGDYRFVLEAPSTTIKFGHTPSYCELILGFRSALFQEYSISPNAVLINAILNEALGEAFQRQAFSGSDFRSLTDLQVVERFAEPYRSWFNPRLGFVDQRFISTAHITLADVSGSLTIDVPRMQQSVREAISRAMRLLGKPSCESSGSCYIGLTPPDYKSIELLHRPARSRVEPVSSYSTQESLSGYRFLFLNLRDALPPEAIGAANECFRQQLDGLITNPARIRTFDLLRAHSDLMLFLNPDLLSQIG